MNKLNRSWILILVAVLSMPYAAHAASIEPKSWELNGSVSYLHTSAQFGFFDQTADITISTLDLEPGAGYFLTSNWEILGTLIFEHRTVSGFLGEVDSSGDAYGLKASAYYHFNTNGAVIPFLGLGFGAVGYSGDDSSDAVYTVPEAILGIRWPVRDVISINFTGGYRRTSTLEDNSSDADQFFLGAGFSVFLQGGATQ